MSACTVVEVLNALNALSPWLAALVALVVLAAAFVLYWVSKPAHSLLQILGGAAKEAYRGRPWVGLALVLALLLAFSRFEAHLFGLLDPRGTYASSLVLLLSDVLIVGFYALAVAAAARLEAKR